MSIVAADCITTNRVDSIEEFKYQLAYYAE